MRLACRQVRLPPGGGTGIGLGTAFGSTGEGRVQSIRRDRWRLPAVGQRFSLSLRSMMVLILVSSLASMVVAFWAVRIRCADRASGVVPRHERGSN